VTPAFSARGWSAAGPANSEPAEGSRRYRRPPTGRRVEQPGTREKGKEINFLRVWASHKIPPIALLPEYCNRGVGTTLLRGLQSEAAAAGKPLRIHVERFNPALRLYERLGFPPIADRGVYLFMELGVDVSLAEDGLPRSTRMSPWQIPEVWRPCCASGQRRWLALRHGSHPT
jgi:GNAT superfamily N-acetyltransferase